jgi:hypothetical protein
MIAMGPLLVARYEFLQMAVVSPNPGNGEKLWSLDRWKRDLKRM